MPPGLSPVSAPEPSQPRPRSPARGKALRRSPQRSRPARSAPGRTRPHRAVPAASDRSARRNIGAPRHLRNHGPRRKTLRDDRSLLILAPPAPTLRAGDHLKSRHRTAASTSASTVICTGGTTYLPAAMAQGGPQRMVTVLQHRATLDRQILRIVRADPVCRLLMTAPVSVRSYRSPSKSLSTIPDGSRTRATSGRILA
jgi:hypothetical protein